MMVSILTIYQLKNKQTCIQVTFTGKKLEAIQRWSAICGVWPWTLTYQKFLLCISSQKLNMYIYWFLSESGYITDADEDDDDNARHHSTTTRVTHRQWRSTRT